MIAACGPSDEASAPESSEKSSETWEAIGYLSPGNLYSYEVIGVYEDLESCRAAGKAWTSRQVVGNPVRYECGRGCTHSQDLGGGPLECAEVSQ